MTLSVRQSPQKHDLKLIKVTIPQYSYRIVKNQHQALMSPEGYMLIPPWNGYFDT